MGAGFSDAKKVIHDGLVVAIDLHLKGICLVRQDL